MRIYKRKTPPSNPDNLQAAIKKYKELAANQKPSFAAVAREFGVSADTLRNHINRGTKRIGAGAPPQIHADWEEVLAKWVRSSCARHLVPTISQLATKAGRLAAHLKNPFKNKLPTRDWLEGFCRRHKLSLRKTTTLDATRASAASNEPMLINWHKEYQEALAAPCDTRGGKRARKFM